MLFDDENDFEDVDCEDCGLKFFVRPSMYTNAANQERLVKAIALGFFFAKHILRGILFGYKLEFFSLCICFAKENAALPRRRIVCTLRMNIL